MTELVLGLCAVLGALVLLLFVWEAAQRSERKAFADAQHVSRWAVTYTSEMPGRSRWETRELRVPIGGSTIKVEAGEYVIERHGSATES